MPVTFQRIFLFFFKAKLNIIVNEYKFILWLFCYLYRDRQFLSIILARYEVIAYTSREPVNVSPLLGALRELCVEDHSVLRTVHMGREVTHT